MSLFCAGVLLLIAVALPGAADAQIKIKASRTSCSSIRPWYSAVMRSTL